MSMNILQRFDTEKASEEGAWLHLTVPGTEGELAYADAPGTDKPIKIKLKGPDSDTWTSFMRKAQRSDSKKDKAKTGDDIRREDSELLSKMVIDWQNIPDESGKGDQECSRDNAMKLFMKYKDIRLQAQFFVMKQENFTKAQLSD